MRLVVGADHAGFVLKQEIAEELRRQGHEVLDVGTHSTEPVDYPDSAEAVGLAVTDGRAERGVLICGSGVGASVAANKVPGRPGRGLPRRILRPPGRRARRHERPRAGRPRRGPCPGPGAGGAFVGARFSGEERHVRRLEKVKAIEARYRLR